MKLFEENAANLFLSVIFFLQRDIRLLHFSLSLDCTFAQRRHRTIGRWAEEHPEQVRSNDSFLQVEVSGAVICLVIFEFSCKSLSAKSLEGIVNSVSSCRSLSTSSEPESASNRKRPSRTPILYTMEPIRLNANNQSLEGASLSLWLSDTAHTLLIRNLFRGGWAARCGAVETSNDSRSSHAWRPDLCSWPTYCKNITFNLEQVLEAHLNVPLQKSASILSSILSKIGLGGGTVELNISKDEEMDDLLEGDLVSG